MIGVLLSHNALRAQTGYATIQRLERGDPVFDEQQLALRDFYRRFGAGEELPELEIYEYRLQTGDTLFGIAARLSVPYAAIATLNRMETTELGQVGDTVLLPSIPGVFVPLIPETDLEQIVHDLRREQPARVVNVSSPGGAVPFRFFPGSDFSQEERSTLLGILFRPPLRSMEISSGFGPRIHPVTSEWGFHAGIDIPAASGDPVLASRSGIVTATGSDPVMGNFILISHSGGFTTFYGHLDTIRVSLNDHVLSGMMIGTVGSTGVTTGSHLHFEIRQNNDPRDPLRLLP